MFEGVRRAMSHRRAAREKKKLRELEKGRRLSHLRMKRLEGHKSAEEELRVQTGAELSAHEAARQAREERRQMEHELRTARGPSAGMRVARGAGRVAKVALYDFPVRSVRVASKLGKSGRLNRLLIGDPQLLLGKPQPGKPQQRTSTHDFIFGPAGKSKDPDVLGIDKDILS